VKRIVNAGRVDIAGADYDGRTPIHIAASEGNLHVL